MYIGTVPKELRTASFFLRPLRANDNMLDYAAMCDRWETQAWVAKGNLFTPEINLAALREHEEEHRAGEALTFTIMNPGETECLGCVYIVPLLPLLQKGNAAEEVREVVTDKDATIRFWLRDTYLSGQWNQELLRTLLAWLKRDWSFPHVIFHTNSQDTRQRALFKAHHFQLLCLLDLSYGTFYIRQCFDN